MTHTVKGKFVWVVTILFCATSVAFAQKKQIKQEPIRQTSAASGKQMFESYCAACHGKTGEGNGPAAEALKVPPANLTLLAKRNHGKFPSYLVTNTLRFGVEAPAHGTSEMPIWGPLFSSLHSGDKAMVMMRINNLTRYIESLQKK